MLTSNLEVLKSCDAQLSEQLSLKPPTFLTFEWITTKTGHLTLKLISADGKPFFLHSAYSPINEGKQFALAHVQKSEYPQTYLLYGFGLGYHVEEMLNLMDNEDRLFVLELNLGLFYLACEKRDLRHILSDWRLQLLVTDHKAHFLAGLRDKVSQSNHLLFYLPAIKAIPQHLAEVRLLLESYKLKQNATTRYGELMGRNRQANVMLNDPEVETLFTHHHRKPFLLLSAGPSLQSQIEQLKSWQDQVVMIAAGPVLKLLLRHGIRPHYFCMIHQTGIIAKQIEGIEGENIPLIYLATAHAATIARYQGPRYICYLDSPARKNGVMSGGSVSTLMLSLAIQMGGNPIIFAGQDLAFTDNQHHADHEVYGKAQYIEILPNMRTVEGISGELLYTKLDYLTFKQWIEQRIKQYQHITFINATAKGARIKGCQHLTLDELGLLLS